MVISSQAALNTRKLQRIIITLLVVLGTVISLLLAHSLENSHPGETTGTSSAANSVLSPVIAEDGQGASSSAVNDEAFAGALALCAALAFACGIAFLVVLVRMMRQSPLVLLRTGLEQLAAIVTRRESPPLSLSLTVLCVSRT